MVEKYGYFKTNKLTQFRATKPALQRTLKGTLSIDEEEQGVQENEQERTKKEYKVHIQ